MTHAANNITTSHLSRPCPVCGGLECLCRPRFFAGQLLTEADLQALDRYIIAKNKLHNRYLHGTGVVCGLQVLCHECKGWITIKTGYAIDPCGNDIIVCKDQYVDVCSKIKECCDRKRTDWECEPLATPPPECEDAEQCWYVTLRYTEFDSRGVTALKQPKTAACGCGGCGCSECQGEPHDTGVNHGRASHRYQHQTCNSRAISSRRPPAPECEPTRTCESFVIDIVPVPPGEHRENEFLKLFDGTILARVYECAKAVEKVKLLRPKPSNLADPQKAREACCLYKKAVWNFLNDHEVTRCELLARVSDQKCSLDIAGITTTMDYLDTLLDEFLKDCICLALLPPCPADPGDPRVILACVRVQRQGSECRIVDICHWHGRRFVWTWPNAFYWIPVGALFKQIFENACCNKEIPDPPEPPPTPATVISVDPIDGASFNDTNAPSSVKIGFSKSLDRMTVNESTVLVSEATIGQLLGTVFYDDSDKSARFTPQAPFPSNSVYTIRVLGSGAVHIKDIDNLDLDGDGDGKAGGDFSSSFTITSLID